MRNEMINYCGSACGSSCETTCKCSSCKDAGSSPCGCGCKSKPGCC
ncbi:hypothetical protein DICA3_E10704 [Diutina catenulata]